MRGDTLNRGQGLLPYGGPGCKSESWGKGWRMRGVGGWVAERVTQHQHPQVLRSVSRLQLRHPPLSLPLPFSPFLPPAAVPLQHPKVQRSQVSV